MRDYLLLTGATGLIGRYLMRNFLAARVPLAVVVRPQSRQTASERIERIVSELEKEIGSVLPRPVCLEGDIAARNLALSPEARNWIARYCGRVLHNAASVSFHGVDRGKEPWRSNLLGAERVLELLRYAQIDEVHWVSTAYVCGMTSEPFTEDQLDLGQLHRNDYERSKFAAEALVRAAGIDSLTVYRPAIVVGDSRSGYTNSYHNIYLFLQFTYLLSQAAERQADGRWYHPARIEISPDEQLNLVPVDWVAAAIIHLLSTPACHGRTYHLTQPLPTTCGEVSTAMARYFNYYGVELVGPSGIASAGYSDIEELFHGSMAAHDSYWIDHPRFDRRNAADALAHLPCPRVGVANLLRLFEFAVRNRFGKRVRARVRA